MTHTAHPSSARHELAKQWLKGSTGRGQPYDKRSRELHEDLSTEVQPERLRDLPDVVPPGCALRPRRCTTQGAHSALGYVSPARSRIQHPRGPPDRDRIPSKLKGSVPPASMSWIKRCRMRVVLTPSHSPETAGAASFRASEAARAPGIQTLAPAVVVGCGPMLSPELPAGPTPETSTVARPGEAGGSVRQHYR